MMNYPVYSFTNQLVYKILCPDKSMFLKFRLEKKVVKQ